jgi:MFS family permease
MTNKNLFLIYALNSSVYFLQGIGGIAGTPLSYYLKETLHFTPSALMFMSSFISLAWVVKPLIGIIIDNSKWTRKTWILLAIAIDLLFALFIGLFTLPFGLLITALMFSNWNTAFRDVSVDGIMVVEGQKYDICGKIQSVQWVSVTVAGIISGFIGSYLAEKNISYQIGFLLLIPFYLIGIFFTSKYKEQKRKGNCVECEGVQYCTYPVHNCSNLKTKKIDYKKLFKNKAFLVACLFLFLYKFNPSFGTPLWYIERDVFHWSKMFIGILGVINSIISIGGAFLYFKFSKKIKNPIQWLKWSVFLGAFTTLLYLYFTPTSDIVYGIVFSSVSMFIHLLVMDWMARQCIIGLESTSFAFLCSVSNLAGNVSGWTGGALLPLCGLQTLIVISALTSFLCLPLINKIGITNEITNEKRN